MTAEPTHPPARRTDLLISLALVALVAVVFGQTARHGFLGYDDPIYITDNPVVQRGLTWDGMRWAFVHGADANYWTPLTFLSHMLDCQLFGLRAGLHHLISVLLHAANAVLLYALLLKLTDQRWPSALVATLFAIHPLHVESVAWIAERKDLLSGMFFLLCLWAYAQHARRGGIGRYLLVLATFALGLMSKPMLVTVPGVMFLVDYWPLKRPVRFGRLVVEKLPMIAMSGGIALFAIVAQKDAGAMRTLDQFSLGFRASNVIVSYARYLLKTLWPNNLAVFYPPPLRWEPIVVVTAAALLLGITIAVVRMRRQRPYLLVGWLWFLGMLLPVIGLVQVGRQAMADRYSYLPHIGLFIAIAYLAAEVRGERTKRIVAGVAISAVLACAVRATDQVRHWQTSETLFTHALAVTGPNPVALNQVGNARARENKLAEAENLYREALTLDPNYGMAHLNLANLLARRRDFAGAEEHYEAALRWRFKLPRAHLGLAVALTGLGEYERADRAFAQAIQLSPRMADAEMSWGLSFKERGNPREAARHLRAALALNPNLDFARRALAELSRPPAATRSSPTMPTPGTSRPAPASP